MKNGDSNSRFHKAFIACAWLGLILTTASCHGHSQQAAAEVHDAPQRVKQEAPLLEQGRILPHVSCQMQPAYSYALYLPAATEDSNEMKLPAIIFFDPHGSGEFVVRKYAHLAEQFHVIILASNDSKNGLSFEQTGAIADALMQEALNRLHANPLTLTLAGFSGGARVALAAAMKYPQPTAVIYCGAAMPMQPGARVFSLLGFAGNADMNYADLHSFDQSLENTAYNHLLIEWNGKHEWPDSSVFRDAFYWITFNQIRDSHQKQTHQTEQFVSEHHNATIHKPSAMQQVAYDELMAFMLNGLTDIRPWQQNASVMKASGEYQNDLKAKQQEIATETTLKQQYANDFESKDLTWWKEEIARMNSITNHTEQPMYNRLLGFISLAGYSLSNNAIRQNNFPVAGKMLAIYRMADPKNSDQAFLEACYYAKQNKNDEAIQSLQRAVDLGLHDTGKILEEPALAGLQGDQRCNALIQNMK